MINKSEIETKAKEFKISARNVERDYVFGWILNEIYINPLLKDRLILKGGNALRKCYLSSTRFSKDLDFSTLQAVDANEMQHAFQSILNTVSEKTGIKFDPTRTDVVEKLVINNMQVYEGRTVFQGFYEEEEASIKIHMDITEFDRIMLPTQHRQLIHPYSDANQFSGQIHVHKLEEVLASKLVALLHRRKPTDIFDFIYAILRDNEYKANRFETLKTFLKKTIYEYQPSTAHEQLKGLALEEARSKWTALVTPISIVISFDEAISQFNEAISALFSLLPAPALSYSPLGYGRRVSYARGQSDVSFYSNQYRNTIISAGENLKMLEVLYDGAWRLVEPYALKYARRKDGHGDEDFWVFDTSGGNSGNISIKRLLSRKVQDMRPTDRTFSPKWPVEL